MSMPIITRAVAVILVAYAAPAWAQQESQTTHRTPAAAATPAQLTACVQSQQQVMALVDAGNRRLELARQTNDPAAMRAAVDEFQTTLSMVRTQLASCAELAAAAPTADPHAGHAMPTTQAAPSPPAAPPPSSADPHAGHVMPPPESAKPAAPAATPPQSAAPRATTPAPRAATPTPAAADQHAGHTMPTSAAPPAAKPAAPAATRPRTATQPATPPALGADPHAGHAMPTPPTAPAATPAAPPAAQPELVEDPVSKTKVDPKTSLRVLHQGKMYYFRSDQERQEFMRNPGKYVSAK